LRVLYLYCHPSPDSLHAAIRVAASHALKTGRHEVDLADLYEESFQPALTAEEHRNYFDPSRNQGGVEDYVARLRAAEALVVQFPTWCFGPPAMLKGFFDRLLIPGVAIDTTYRSAKPMLGNIRRIVGVVTYGQPWSNAFWMGDQPRRMVTRFLPWFTGARGRARYLALYNVDKTTPEVRQTFIGRVEQAMRTL
jgi:putative NADPH-quinone reductase